MASSATSSASSTPSGPREEIFLENYFHLLSQFTFDKAKEMAEKDKDGLKISSASSWGTLLQCLVQFATAEKMYMSLNFLGQKRFHPIVRSRENLRNMYLFLMQEFRRIEDSAHQVPCNGAAPCNDLEILLAHLCGQLCHYLTARQKMMDLYEQMSAMTTSKNMSFEDLVTVVTDIIQAHSKGFHHPLISPLKFGFSLECDIINHLLQAQILMAEWQFLPSLLQLHQTHSKLTSWASTAAIKEVKKGFVSNSKSSSLPALYQWLVRFKGLLVSKFSLYFHEVLSKQTTPVDMKSWSVKTTDDFVGKIVTFQKKSDASSVSLVFDTNGIEDHYKGPGYHHPDKFVEPPKGLDSYPPILTFPGERPTAHWPNIIMLINQILDKPDHANQDKVHCVYDKRAQNTYFISRVDPRIWLVLIFETKKSEKDSYINNFMMDLISYLKCTKVLGSLKAGSKS